MGAPKREWSIVMEFNFVGSFVLTASSTAWYIADTRTNQNNNRIKPPTLKRMKPRTTLSTKKRRRKRKIKNNQQQQKRRRRPSGINNKEYSQRLGSKVVPRAKWNGNLIDELLVTEHYCRQAKELRPIATQEHTRVTSRHLRKAKTIGRWYRHRHRHSY